MPNVKKSLILAVLALAPCFGQKPAQYYHLDFSIKEVEAGKAPTTRIYSTMISLEGPGINSIRNGDKLPVQSGPGTTYIDVGVNIDCKGFRLVDDQLAMYVTADISSAVSEGRPGPPIIRQLKWSSSVIVPLRKATTIFSSDGASGKHQTQLELTATPIP